MPRSIFFYSSTKVSHVPTKLLLPELPEVCNPHHFPFLENILKIL